MGVLARDGERKSSIAVMYEGRNQLINRLAWQVGSRDLALKLLRRRGHMDEEGNLTAAGRARDVMTAAEREKDRGDKPGSSNRRKL